MTKADLIDQAIDAYLEQQPGTLFGRAFDIKSDTGRPKAHAWLRRHFEGIVRIGQEIQARGG